MKTLQFSEKSWHYRFIKHYTKNEDYELDNICSYTRCFFQATMVVLLLLILVTFASFCATQVLVGVAFSLWYGMWIFSEVAAFTMVIIAAFATAIGILLLGHKIKEMNEDRRRSGVPDSFVVNAYKSWKDKFCARVEIVRPAVEEGPAEY